MQINNKTLEIPIIQGGMGVGVSLGNLAGHVAKCGAIGIISSVNAGYREEDFRKNTMEANLRALRNEIVKAKTIADGKGLVGVNIMTAVTHYEETCRCAAEAGADVIISGAGIPLSLPEHVKGTDTLIAPIVSSARAARLLIRHYEKHYHRRPDFFVMEGHMAGGHLGFAAEDLRQDTCKTNMEILQEIRQLKEIRSSSTQMAAGELQQLEEIKEAAGEIPVFIAGGVFDGKDMAACIKAGAAGVQIGTRFIATEECDAAAEFKQAIVRAKQEDIAIIESPVGMPARAVMSPMLKRLKNGEGFPAIRCNNCLTACRKKDSVYCISRALIEAVKGNWEDGLFFTGSNGARVENIVPVRELIDEIMQEYQVAIEAPLESVR